MPDLCKFHRRIKTAVIFYTIKIIQQVVSFKPGKQVDSV